jgi:hypothetical protein
MIIDVKNGIIYDEYHQFKLGDKALLYNSCEKSKILYINKSHVIFKGEVCLSLVQFGKANFGIFSKKNIFIKMT